MLAVLSPKCDNQRPFCKKCIDTGRDCEGYERKAVFIIGTPQDGGRCSSHPRRVVSKKAKGSSLSPSPAITDEPTPEPESEAEPERLDLKPVQPFEAAWNDLVSLSTGEVLYNVQIAALHTSIAAVTRQGRDSGNSNSFTISLPPYVPLDARPVTTSDDFTLRSQCLVYTTTPAQAQEGQADDIAPPVGEGICLFLYEVSRFARFKVWTRC